MNIYTMIRIALFGVFGFTLVMTGAGIFTWQFWLLLMLATVISFVSNLEGCTCGR